MNWEERILSSDAGRGNREVAEKMIREGRERVPETLPDSLEAHLSEGCPCTDG